MKKIGYCCLQGIIFQCVTYNQLISDNDKLLLQKILIGNLMLLHVVL